MFWRWWAPWDFMNTEPGQHESQWNSISQRLFGLTFWGDYGGTIVSRFYYDSILEAAPLAVGSIEAMHGQGLVLIAVEPDNEEYRDQLREVIRFLAYFDPESREYDGYGIWDVDGLNEYEWKLAEKEMSEGWWAEYTRGELVRQFDDWEDNTLVPETGTEEWNAFLYEFYWQDGDQGYTYWEGADSLIVENFDIEEAANFLLDRYAAEITNAGNPSTHLVETEGSNALE